MNSFIDKNLNIVVDRHHFVLLSKDEVCSTNHLIAFNKGAYTPKNFFDGKRANLSRNLNRIGVI